MPTVLMTGGHAGLGFEGARTLVERFGCNLILSGRNPERVGEAAFQLRKQTSVRIDVLTMDLNSIASVRAGAAQCKAMLQTEQSGDGELKGIICNAGAQFRGPVSYSADGYEETFASNCLGHFLLINLLLDSVATRGRIIWTASGTHNPASMDGKTVGGGCRARRQGIGATGTEREADLRRAAVCDIEAVHNTVCVQDGPATAADRDAGGFDCLRSWLHPGNRNGPNGALYLPELCGQVCLKEDRGYDGPDAVLRRIARNAGGGCHVRRRFGQVFSFEEWGAERGPVLGRVVRRGEGSQALERLGGAGASRSGRATTTAPVGRIGPANALHVWSPLGRSVGGGLPLIQEFTRSRCASGVKVERTSVEKSTSLETGTSICIYLVLRRSCI